MNEELKVIITAEIDQLKKEVDTAKKQIDKFTKEGNKGFQGFGEAMKKAGAVGKTALKAAAVGVAALGTAVVGLSESTKEYRENQAKLETAFETAGASAATASQTYNDLYRVLGDDDVAVEAAGHLAQLTTNQEDLSEWTDICQGVYATFGDSLPIESLTEAANETAKTGELTGALADALNWAGINEADFAANLMMCNDEAEREALIRETLTGVYGDAAASYEENARTVLAANEAQAKLNEALGKLGEVVTPIVTLLKGGLAATLLELTPYLDMVSQGLEDIINGVDGGAEKMSAGIQGIIDSLLGTITTALPEVLGIGVEILRALIEGVAQALPDVVAAITDIIPVILGAIGELLPLLISAILNALPSIVDCLFEAVAQILTIIGEILPDIVVEIIEIIPLLVDSILDNIPTLINAAVSFLMAIIQAIPQIIPPLMKALPTIINSIVNALINNAPVLLKAGVTVFMEIVKSIPKILPELLKGLSNMVSSVKTNLVEKLKSALKFKWELPKIKMPSIGVEWQQSPAWLAEAAKFIGLQGIPKFKVSWNALGGVFDKPTVFNYGGSLQGIGEDGAEAVVPLENNLEWLNKLANMLSERMGSTPVVLQVDGQTFAKTSIRTINNLTRQSGKLALNIV